MQILFLEHNINYYVGTKYSIQFSNIFFGKIKENKLLLIVWKKEDKFNNLNLCHDYYSFHNLGEVHDTYIFSK